MMPDIGDIIEIVRDIPKKNLRAGTRGAVVHCHGNDFYEIEFTDKDGETLDFLALNAINFVVVWRAKNRRWIPIAEQTSALVAALPDDAARQVLDFALILSLQTYQSSSFNNYEKIAA